MGPALLLLAIATAAPPAFAQPSSPPAQPSSTPAAPHATSPEERLAEGRAAYFRNDFEATKRAVGPLIFPDTLLRSESDVIEAHKLLALSHFFLDELASAETEFLSLLQLRPSFELDVLLEPRPVIDFFEQLKGRQRERLYEIEQRRRQEADRAARQAELRRKAEEEELLRKVKKTTVIERRLWFVNLVPFGAGQFQNGHKRKAVALLTTQLALGATSLSLWAYLQSRYYSSRLPVPAEEFDQARAVSVAQLVTGALFYADVLAGIIDALICYRPTTVTTTLTAGGDGAAPSLSISPMPLPGGGGVSLGGMF